MTPKRVDANQKVIVAALEDAGATVTHLHEVGKGCPDILVGYGKQEHETLLEVVYTEGSNYLMEIKDGSKPPSKRKLTPAQKKWHNEWRGQVAIVYDIDDALRVIGVLK